MLVQLWIITTPFAVQPPPFFVFSLFGGGDIFFRCTYFCSWDPSGHRFAHWLTLAINRKTNPSTLSSFLPQRSIDYSCLGQIVPLPAPWRVRPYHYVLDILLMLGFSFLGSIFLNGVGWRGGMDGQITHSHWGHKVILLMFVCFLLAQHYLFS